MIARLVRNPIPKLYSTQCIFAIFYAVFSTGALEKATPMRVSATPIARRCHNRDSFAYPADVTEVLRLSCPICNVRKEKRFCLALHDRICAQCCGEQREVTLECPSECPYLQQARLHEKPRDLAENPPEEMFPAIRVRQDFLHEHEHLIAGILATLAKLSRADRHLKDRELIAALANMVRSQQRLISSGLVYEEATPNLAQQGLITTLRQVLEEYREVERQHLGHVRLKDADVLPALVFTLRLAHAHTSGRPLSRAFIDFLQQQFPEAAASLESTAEPGGRIIIP